MKIRLYVNDEEFLIEECEGAPEIRRATAAKFTADRSLTTYPFDGCGERALERASVHLKVEAAS